MANANEICRMDAVELTKQIRAKKLSPVEVVDAVLDRIAKLDPILHAFSTLVPEQAREDAKRTEKAIMTGGEVGPLAGVPIGMKDLFFVKGVRTTFGSYVYKDFVPDEDDVAVERLRNAGVTILGQTNVPEFGYSGVGHNPIFETTRNPWNTDLTPGGSSAGSAAAVATGMGPVSIGTDGGGSVRLPSSLSGLYAIKPSYGRVPSYPSFRDERYPGSSAWETLIHIAPISRTVADGALMLSVMAGPDDRDRHSIPSGDIDWMKCLEGAELKGKRIAYSSDWGYAAVDPEVRETVGKAVKVFERDLGCIVEEANPGWPDLFFPFWALLAGETDLKGMREMVQKHGDRMSSHIVDFATRNWAAEDLTNANITRKMVYNKMWKFMRKYDLLLTPTTNCAAFPLLMQGPEKIEGRYVPTTHWLSFTFPINMTGQPAASVPAGWTKHGLPVGLQIIGPHLGDAIVLKASAAYEAAAPWKDKWPPLLAKMNL
jgi:aspartyl-tRNA(Asn)/glutamyl-tRNA(Gln) amidotransferase subunit A